MTLGASPTEITTSGTDALLAIECAVILAYLWRSPTGDRWRIRLWCWVLGLLAFASFLGSVTHGLEMPQSLRAALWKPLYLSLGLLVALFLVGAVFDWHAYDASLDSLRLFRIEGTNAVELPLPPLGHGSTDHPNRLVRLAPSNRAGIEIPASIRELRADIVMTFRHRETGKTETKVLTTSMLRRERTKLEPMLE